MTDEIKTKFYNDNNNLSRSFFRIGLYHLRRFFFNDRILDAIKVEIDYYIPGSPQKPVKINQEKCRMLDKSNGSPSFIRIKRTKYSFF